MSDIAVLRNAIDQLRRQSEKLSTAEQMEAILDDARLVLKRAFQTEVEEDARKLFRDLRERKEHFAPATNAEAQTGAGDRDNLVRRVQRERTRLGSGGSLNDMELAVRGLYGALRDPALGGDPSTSLRAGDDPLRGEILSALESAANAKAELRQVTTELLMSTDLAQAADVQALLTRLAQPAPAPRSEERPPSSDVAPPLSELSPEIFQQLGQARRLFYAGDYYEAADALTAILRAAPNAQEARERLAQIEDHIKRGIVPDSRVPFEARTAFGRAQSLERAGRFEEARESYRLALEEARKGGPLLQNWLPAVEALMRVDNSMIARESSREADSLLKADQWREAAEKYDVVLKLLPDDSQARERLGLLQKVQEQTEAMRAQLSDLGGNLADASSTVAALRQTIAALRPKLPESQRLNELETEVGQAALTVKSGLLERSQKLVAQARFLSKIAESKGNMAAAVQLLEHALRLSPDDPDIIGQTQATSTELARLAQAEKDLEEVRRLIGLNTEESRQQAREMLRGIQEFDQDPSYLQLLTALRRQFLGEVENALRQKQVRAANYWLSAAKEGPFAALEPSDDMWTLERELASARREPWLRLLGWGGVMVVLLLLVGGLGARFVGAWVAQTPSATPTALQQLVLQSTATTAFEPTRQATAMPAIVTPILSATPQPTPSETPIPSPSLTPTAAPRYGAVKENSAARLSPSGLSPWAFTLRAADPVQVLAEETDSEGRLWYKILYVREESTLIGWAQASDINVQPVANP